jgi:NitT/TauT family transport system substrate-binding protein
MTKPVSCPESKVRNLSRRRVLQAGASAALLGAPAFLRAQAMPKIRVGFWPIASGLPFFVAIEKGYFKEAGLDVEGIKFAGAQQVMEAMLSGRSDGSANGTGLGEPCHRRDRAARPLQDLLHEPEQRQVRARRVHRAKDSAYKTIADFKGKRPRVGSRHPECDARQDHARARWRHGTTVIELPIGQHVASIVAGQVDGAYTLEPTGTVGRMNGTTRVVEAGVVGASTSWAIRSRPGMADRRASRRSSSRRIPRRRRSTWRPTSRVWSSCAPSRTRRGNT